MFVVSCLIQTFTLVFVSCSGRSITRRKGNMKKTFELVCKPTKTYIASAMELFQNKNSLFPNYVEPTTRFFRLMDKFTSP